MNSIEIAKQATNDLSGTLNKIAINQVDSLIEQLKSSRNIFVSGAGRSLLIMKAFAMRLMHVGLNVYVVGEVTTPAFQEGDLLVIASGSGETENLLSIAKRAKSFGGKITAITIFEQSSLAHIAEHTLKIPAYSDKLPENDNNKKGILPGGSIFEQAILLLCDSIIITFIESNNVNIDKGFKKHANLE